ncbi:unnamed protein product [Effrenium voratum]|nr:unnamed protein product [Effrenium voratum]
MPMPTSRMRRSANAALAAVLSAVACRPWALVLARLPGTSSPQEVAQVLKQDGVVVLEQRSSKETVAAALEELSTGRMSGGRNVRFGDSTQLLKWPLDPAKEPALMSLAEDPLVLQASELARQEHGEGSHHGIAWEVRLLILPPGMPEGDMHRDVVDTSKIPLQRPLQWGLNTIWATDAFTLENGATRFECLAATRAASSRAPGRVTTRRRPKWPRRLAWTPAPSWCTMPAPCMEAVRINHQTLGQA